jgi:hypothetical protein
MTVTYNYVIDYDFYTFYLTNNRFLDIFEKRITYIKNKYSLTMDDNEIIKEYFVEIFSWSVIPHELLFDIATFLKEKEIKYIIDPSCGNAFHTFLFDTFCNINTLSCDIQKEENAWIETIEQDGRKFIDELNKTEHCKRALILSWIDGEKLAKELLDKFTGNIVISIGNYVIDTDYIEHLQCYFELKKIIILNMPWELNEKIEIYVRK